MTAPVRTPVENALVIGASRGLGKALVQAYAERGAHVVATVRDDRPAPLHDVASRHPGSVEVERVDVTDRAQLSALRDRLADRTFDLLFVVAGVSLAEQDAVGADIADEAFDRMMRTNVLGVMRAVETLRDLVTPTGTIAVMSSGQGSVADNTKGGFEVYRATKSALNQMFRSHAARHRDERRALLLMAPGWVRTDLGGPGAALDVDESIPPLVETVDAQHGEPGLRFLDRHGRAVAW